MNQVAMNSIGSMNVWCRENKHSRGKLAKLAAFVGITRWPSIVYRS